MNVTRRWRLLLGRYAEGDLPLSSEDQEVEDALSYLYDREYEMRGHRRVRPDGGGTLDPSHPMGLHWLKRSREIFPASALERMERDAIAEYGINELLGDPQAVETVHASADLAAVLLRTRGSLAPETSDGVRALIAKVIAEIMERLRPQFTTALTGSTALRRRSHHASLRNLDWRGTIAANLKNVDPQSGTMLVSDVRFLAGKRRRNLNWQVTLLVDQSLSMADSVLHSAISAAIIAGLPGITVRLLLFDTSVVDMSYLVEDPIEVLMTSQLGGGTDIAKALTYAERQIDQPSRSVVVLITDFDEGGSVSALVAATKRLAEAGVRLLGLASLAGDASPRYNRQVAARLANVGMEIAAMTPDHFANWLAEVTQ